MHPTFPEVPAIMKWRTCALSGKPFHVSQLKVFAWIESSGHAAPSGSNKNIFSVQ
jgi:hypothetical protein